jgi:hypothetical protein
MRLTWKDLVATALVAAVVVPCIGYMVAGSVPFIQDPTGMAWLGLALSMIVAAVGGWITQSGAVARLVTVVVGIAAVARPNRRMRWLPGPSSPRRRGTTLSRSTTILTVASVACWGGLIPASGRRQKAQCSCLSIRQPPARLLAMIALNMAVRAVVFRVSPLRTAMVRAVLFSWPAVMIPCGSGTMPPS